MANNRVDVRITARDEISGVVRNIKGNISSIGAVAAGVTTALVGMALAVGGVMKLSEGLSAASKMQTTIISGAGDVATMMGVSYNDALKNVKETQKEISKMAASLPGETAGYGAIASAISSSIAKGAQGDMQKYKTDILDVTKTLGMLAATKGVNMDMAASASVKFVNGSANLSEMFSVNDVFQKNQPFKDFLLAELANMGKQEKDWKSLSQDVRNKAIKLAGAKAFSPEMLKALEMSTESRFQTLKSGLFDPLTGMFGWMRELPGGTGKTALDSVGEFLRHFTAMSVAIGKFGNSMGINIDPMQEAANVINSLSKQLKNVTDIFDAGGDVWGNLTKLTIDSASNSLNKISNSVQSVNWAAMGEEFGNTIGKILTDEKFGIALERILISSVNALGDAIDGAITGLIKTINKYLADVPNRMLNDATGGFLGESADGGLNGYQKWANDVDKLSGGKGDAGSAPLKGAITPLEAPSQSIVPKTTSSLPSLSQMSNSSSRSNTFAPTITLTASNAGGDIQATADYILLELNKQFTQYRDTVLA